MWLPEDQFSTRNLGRSFRVEMWPLEDQFSTRNLVASGAGAAAFGPEGLVDAGEGGGDGLELLGADLVEEVARIEGFDALLSPTLPMVAPAIAPLLASDERFFAANSLLLRNPSMVNMLDGCALSLPCPTDGGLPVGLMVWGPAMCDDAVLSASLAIESALAGVR